MEMISKYESQNRRADSTLPPIVEMLVLRKRKVWTDVQYQISEQLYRALQHSQVHPSLQIPRRFLTKARGVKLRAVTLSVSPMADCQSPMGDAVNVNGYRIARLACQSHSRALVTKRHTRAHDPKGRAFGPGWQSARFCLRLPVNHT